MTTEQYVSWFEEVLAPTEPMFLLVPQDRLDWKLTARSFTLGQLLDHIPKSLWFNTRIITGETWPLKSMREILVANRRHPRTTVEEAVANVRSSSAQYCEAIRRGGDVWFQTGEIDTPQLGRVPVWRLAAFVIEHHIHHLEELHLCLKVLGAKVDTGTLYKGAS